MIDLKTFRKIKELKEKGVTTMKILEEINISKGMYYKCGLLSEETFIKHLKNELIMVYIIIESLFYLLLA